MIDSTELQNLYGRTVVGSDGDKIGKVKDVYRSNDVEGGAFVTVSTGLFGTKSSFIPLDQATVTGDDLVVPYGKDMVKDAPRVDDDEQLSATEEDRLYEHYRISGGSGAARDQAVGQAQGDLRSAGHDTSGPNTDDAMTRSEERLQVGTQTQEAGRARLRKYIVTENETRTIPVSHEEVRVEREAITDANRGDALDGPALSEEEHEVVLSEERPVIGKETVPVERVRLGTEEVTEQTTVSEDVRHEVIELDDQATAGRDRR
jgi:uncharacterized protein (TIGR02271 family)